MASSIDTHGVPDNSKPSTVPTVSQQARLLKAMGARLGIFLACVIYLELLVIGYRDYVSPAYDYFNFVWADFTVADRILALCLILPMVLIPPSRNRTVSEVSEWILIFTVFIPCLVIPIASGYVQRDAAPVFSVMVFASFLALHFIREAISRGKPINLPRLSPTSFTLLLVTLWGTISIALIASADLSSIRESFADIYDTRAEYSANVSSQNIFLAYAIPFATKVLNPFLVVWGFERRQLIFVMMGFLGSILVFSANAQKSVLLTIMLVPIAYFLVRNRQRLSSLITAVGFVALAAISIFSPVIMEYIFRRVVMVPGLLVGLYFDNFNNGQYAYLQHSIFSVFSSQERMSPTREVGLNYWGRSTIAPNVNFLGDGFANFGFAGMLIFAASLGIALGYLDRVTRANPLNVNVAVFIGVVFALIDTALLTTLMTHGFLAAILFLGILPKDSRSMPISKVNRPKYRGIEISQAKCKPKAGA